jgi:hypothetical protein
VLIALEHTLDASVVPVQNDAGNRAWVGAGKVARGDLMGCVPWRKAWAIDSDTSTIGNCAPVVSGTIPDFGDVVSIIGRGPSCKETMPGYRLAVNPRVNQRIPQLPNGVVAIDGPYWRLFHPQLPKFQHDCFWVNGTETGPAGGKPKAGNLLPIGYPLEPVTGNRSGWYAAVDGRVYQMNFSPIVGTLIALAYSTADVVLTGIDLSGMDDGGFGKTYLERQGASWRALIEIARRSGHLKRLYRSSTMTGPLAEELPQW